MIRCLQAILVAGLVFTVSALSAQPEDPGFRNTAVRPARSTEGMISSAHPLATKAGWEILNAGGNAFDAAVAVAAALNVVEPMMSGMGGFGVTLLYDAEKGVTRCLDARSEERRVGKECRSGWAEDR